MRASAVVAGNIVLSWALSWVLSWTLCCALLAPRPAAQCPTSYLLTGSTQFGQALDVSGDSLLLGDGSHGFGGMAIVMRRAPFGWKAETLLFSSAPESSGRFGDAVAVSGQWAAVGAPGELGGAGAVHVFRRVCEPSAPGAACTWEWVARLLPSAAAAGDRFGTALALDGARLIVASPGSDLAASNAGALFVFEAASDTWTQVQTLLPVGDAGALANAGLGSCVALGDDVAVAGSKANAAWLFERGTDGFGAPAVLGVPGAGGFGQAVATDGAAVLVGAPGTNLTAIKSGAVYVFEPPTSGGAGAGGRHGGGTGEWNLTATLPAPAVLFGSFGTSVALDGATAAVGAPGVGAGHGVLYLLHRDATGWLADSSFDALPGPESLGLGITAALDADTLVAGARAALGPPGVVYTFGAVAPWVQLGGGVAGSAGLPLLAVDGSLCGGDTLSWRLSQAKASSFAMFVIGLAAMPQPWKGGVLWPRPDCLVPVAVGADGKATLSLHVPQFQPGGLEVVAQVWIADSGTPSGLAATSGVRGKTP